MNGCLFFPTCKQIYDPLIDEKGYILSFVQIYRGFYKEKNTYKSDRSCEQKSFVSSKITFNFKVNYNSSLPSPYSRLRFSNHSCAQYSSLIQQIFEGDKLVIRQHSGYIAKLRIHGSCFQGDCGLLAEIAMDQ